MIIRNTKVLFVALFFLIACGKDEPMLTEIQKQEMEAYIIQAEAWSEIFIDKPLMSFSAFAPETKSPQSANIGTVESKALINGFVMDLGIPNDRFMHDWLIGYGKLIRKIKVDNVLPAEEELYRSLVANHIDLTASTGTDRACIMAAHIELQRHAYNKANSYDVTVQSVSGPAFDLNDFMTLRGIGSGLYRIHRFIENRNGCR